uniref:Uncharacterized protein n=1 Tax=viral metagenome TaxID=1070528 RepID=A0A6C0KXA0_9ZZZZ|tara:strand:+ start:5530 stop:6189 length:660 start_codon:yes stop_codon:yes gene_type:complete
MVVGRVSGNGSVTKQIGGLNLEVGRRENRNLKYDYFRLRILYERVLFQLRPPMTLYNEGEFEFFMSSMPNVLTLTRVLNNQDTFFINDQTQLNSYKYQGGLVDKYIFVTNRLVDTIKQAMSEYIKIRNLENENSELKSYKEILENREKLLEYLEQQQNTGHLFSANATLQVEYKLKLWYAVYMERHGPPGDGVFNSELLAEIIEELVASGQVSEDELIF